MELIIKESNPARWERHRLRKGEDKEGDGEGEVRPEGENPPEPPEAADGEEDAVYSDGEAGPEDLFGYNGPESASALTDHKQEEEDRTSGTASRPAGRESDSYSLVQRLCSVDVCEVFSPPRVGKEATKFGMKPGDAMDLTTGWDFNLASHRAKAEAYVDKEKPLVLIGSPPCVAFSQLQSLIPDSDRKAKQLP